MQDKVILITGGARRIGAAIVRRLHAAGGKVMLHYRRSATAAEALADELNQIRPGSVEIVQGDLLDIAALPALVEATLLRFGRLDGLVNNASSFFPTPLGSIDLAAWDDLIGSNLKAPLFLCQAAAPALRASGGAIVNIADIHAERPMREHVVYSIAKAGLVALTRSLARELGPQVRVNAVAPGTNVWPEGDSVFDAAARQQILASVPLQRGGEPDDIAYAVQFLLGAPYVSGQVLAVDGGRSVTL